MKIRIEPYYFTRRDHATPLGRRRWKRQVAMLSSRELAPGESQTISFHIAASYEQLEDFIVVGTIEGFGVWYTRALRVRERTDVAGALVTTASIIVVNTLSRPAAVRLRLEWSQDERATQELLS